MLTNTEKTYGLISKLLHWLIALAVFGLFGLGLWMVELDYYDSWYQKAPHWHKSLGVLLAVTLLIRSLWRWTNPIPQALASHRRWEVRLARLTHITLYGVLFALVVSGYLISTADGRGIEVFNWFTLPSAGEFFERQEDLAGSIHYWLAISVIALACLHATAALKHHFIDRDGTLRRML